MKCKFLMVPEWPSLGWLACCRRDDEIVSIFHGNRVETVDDWFCEAVWAGPYKDGDFDRTDIVSGSGGRIRGNSVVFVSSGSTVDRLVVARLRDCVYISNSIACLFSAIDANADQSYIGYYEDFYSIVDGINNYKKNIPTSNYNVDLIYFRNVSWNGVCLTETNKPYEERKFSDFSDYMNFMNVNLRSFSDNMKCTSRRYSYEMMSTLSSGYDSSAVTTLVASHGCKTAMSFDQTHLGVADDGNAVAECLNINQIVVSAIAWKSIQLSEVPFIASNAMGEEVRFKAAEDILQGKILMTGYHGDKMWDLHTKSLGRNIVRGDPSGLGLSEYRLWAGFIHCPLPFWGVRQIRDVQAISAASEMQPWDVGGDYNRPICRRIVEEAGIPRDAFGVKKKMASQIRHNDEFVLTDGSMEDYVAWLRIHRWSLFKSRGIPMITSPKFDRFMFNLKDIASSGASQLPLIWRVSGRLSSPNYFRRFLFHWATEHALKRYPVPW